MFEVLGATLETETDNPDLMPHPFEAGPLVWFLCLVISPPIFASRVFYDGKGTNAIVRTHAIPGMATRNVELANGTVPPAKVTNERVNNVYRSLSRLPSGASRSDSCLIEGGSSPQGPISTRPAKSKTSAEKQRGH